MCDITITSFDWHQKKPLRLTKLLYCIHNEGVEKGVKMKGSGNEKACLHHTQKKEG